MLVVDHLIIFFFNQNAAYEMRISDWISDVCSSDLLASWLVAVSLIPMLSAKMKTPPAVQDKGGMIRRLQDRYAAFLRWTLEHRGASVLGILVIVAVSFVPATLTRTNMFGGEDIGEIDVFYQRSEEHTSELQSLMRISYAVFC